MQPKIIFTIFGFILGVFAGFVVFWMIVAPLIPIGVIFCGTGSGCSGTFSIIFYWILRVIVISIICMVTYQGYVFGEERAKRSEDRYGKLYPVGLIVFALFILLIYIISLGSDVFAALLTLPLSPPGLIFGFFVSLVIGGLLGVTSSFSQYTNDLLEKSYFVFLSLPNAILIGFLVDLFWKRKHRKLSQNSVLVSK